MKILTKMSLAILPVLLLAGCFGSTGDVKEAAPPEDTVAVEDQAPAQDTAPPAGEEMVAEQAPVDPLDDPNNVLATRTVYFDFDSSTVRDDALPVIRAHAEHLVSNPSLMFTLEGHADERGTREYNLALGERRADSVRRLLLANGVAANQINVISYGEERPAKLGHDDSAWDANRRAELVYQR
ncbi:MAG: peptidoglycan-associated lipoprotein Pal [Gammaproteobacteria bacterium]|nr:peptidoglycan-associated lipoprotein Pal [Gammaproteobacteria bacterium]MDH5801434.1 peptidoglycan-associated lipoprotein Pal [Gammaproteobacteria bacterium]